MDWQFLLTVALIGIAGCAVVWHFIRFVQSTISGTHCGSGCGKCKPTLPNKDSGRIGLPMIERD